MITTRVIMLAATALHRAAWEVLLKQQPGVEAWGTAANIDDVAVLVEPGHPSTILVDLPLSTSHSPDFVRQLVQVAPNGGTLCLVDRYDLAQVIALLRAGALGCLVRDATVADLALAVIAAGRGDLVLPPSLAAQALAALARGELRPQRPPESLTDREIEVLGLLAQGLTNKDIAQRLFLSVRTIEAHLRHIYSKLGMASRTEAALWAVENRE
ncbi:MAG TPA: response regulator transcription factor [Chloroflexota bacterium]|nr:response regulator transcription factor [Chloroflexota bacterium]HUM67449.1 response regulator transcription factor [Chloroflexota bacterium]